MRLKRNFITRKESNIKKYIVYPKGFDPIVESEEMKELEKQGEVVELDDEQKPSQIGRWFKEISEKEYQETLNKAKGLLKAIEFAEGGFV